jgi:pimeloyl-ACP methyl ester carboxylesterase
VESARGTFAVLEALPLDGTCELGTALLVPGYTGSKEDFIPVLGRLAGAGRRVLAVDMRGQFQTPGPDDVDAYDPRQLGRDIAAVAEATETAHLLGHSFGGLVVRETVLSCWHRPAGLSCWHRPAGLSCWHRPAGLSCWHRPAGLHGAYTPRSLTLMSSGPAAVPGPRAEELRFTLNLIANASPQDLKGKIAEIWHKVLQPQAIADGVPAPVVAFLKERMLASNPTGLATMARHLLTAVDKTGDLAGHGIPALVLYGEDDNAWPPSQQEDMAGRLNARRARIPGAAHSPAVEAPAATAHELTSFWNSVEGIRTPAGATSTA